LQPIEQPIQAHVVNARKELHLHGEGGEDVLLAHQTHVAGHLAELRLIQPAPHRLQHALHLDRRQHLQIDENLAKAFALVHRVSVREL